MGWQEIVAWSGTVCAALMCGAIIFRAARDEGRHEGWSRGYDQGSRDAERAFQNRRAPKAKEGSDG